ncbi:MAG: Nramp family divalent metal transporter [Bacteroidetes bacterium]|nr:Nramp family divalent metal transporter [Bacteroidota bacterium]MBU1720092.1 Nramp family divalent metal transporter [Bacteroidota bacterium]
MLGPGLLWAGAAIGVSHLVQSTRAGASYGFELVWVIIAANLFKYPFFEFAPRYTVATGESLLEGYNRLGRWGIALYILLTFGTMFTLQAAITIVTAGVTANIFFPGADILTVTIVLLIGCAVIIAIGRYSVLDRIIKAVIILLTLSTIFAVFSALFGVAPERSAIELPSFNWSLTDLAFLIAFVGWMPTAIDVSVWHSYWTLAKKEQSPESFSMKPALFDFNVGYFGTAFLAVGFLSLGALVMHNSGETFSDNSTMFASQVIKLYTSSIGNWAYYIIAVAALATMFSTTLTCLDAYPRVLTPAFQLLVKRKTSPEKKWMPIAWILMLIVGSSILVAYFVSSLKFLVDLATTLSFLTAPVLGYMNFRVVTAKHVPEQHRPSKAFQFFSIICLIVLSAVAVYYLIWRFGNFT